MHCERHCDIITVRRLEAVYEKAVLAVFKISTINNFGNIDGNVTGRCLSPPREKCELDVGKWEGCGLAFGKR